MSDAKPQTTMSADDWSERCDMMQHTIDELHKALWIAIQDSDGEIVVTAEEQAAMPPPGKIEWLRSDDQSVLVIRAMNEVPDAN